MITLKIYLYLTTVRVYGTIFAEVMAACYVGAPALAGLLPTIGNYATVSVS